MRHPDDCARQRRGDPRSAAFGANQDRMAALVHDLRRTVDHVPLGGGEASRQRHIGRGKLPQLKGTQPPAALSPDHRGTRRLPDIAGGAHEADRLGADRAAIRTDYPPPLHSGSAPRRLPTSCATSPVPTCSIRLTTPLAWGHVNPYGPFRLDMTARLTLDLPMLGADAGQLLFRGVWSQMPTLTLRLAAAMLG